MSGPPLVLWVMAHDWSTERIRGFLFAWFLSLVTLQLALLYAHFGRDVLQGILLGGVLSPAVLGGSLTGLRLGDAFSKPVLRRLAYTVLLAIALNAMYPQMKRWMQKNVFSDARHSPHPRSAAQPAE